MFKGDRWNAGSASRVVVVYNENPEALREGDVDAYQTENSTFPGKERTHKDDGR